MTAVVAGLIGLAASLVGLDIGLTPRHFTASEQQKIIAWEVGRRWRTWPPGEIFPASVTYQLPAEDLASDVSLTLTARRVGIAPEASCVAVTDSAAAGVLARHGCTTVLRASYVDATGTFVTTVGLAVMPSAAAATAAQVALSGPAALRPGIRVAAFPGTLTAWSSDAGRQVSFSVPAGPYLVMYVAGYADGRPRAPVAGDQYGQGELLSSADGIADHIAGKIGAQPPPPRCPGVPGC